jgi:protein TonB
MEPKKTPRADLSRKSFLFFNIGLVTSLSLAIAAFTYKVDSGRSKGTLVNTQGQIEELIDVPVTEHLRPPQPKLEQPRIIEVPDNKVIEEQITVDMDMEITPLEINVNAPVQVEVEEEDPNTLFTVVEESASPVGGITAFTEFVSKNLVYPAMARRMDIQGKVYVEFIVERDGTITNVRTMKGIGAGCDEEAVRVVSISPKWNPGKQRGRAVRQKMILPINFRQD